MTEVVLINLTTPTGPSEDLIGATVTIKNADNDAILYSYTWNGTQIEASIRYGITYKIVCGSVSEYFTPIDKEYTADYLYTRSVTMEYLPYIGIYIEDTLGNVYKSSNWDSTKTPNSILFLTENSKFRIALEDVSKPIHNSAWGNIENYLTPIGPVQGSPDSAKAIADLDGKGNTQKLINFNTANGINNTNYAAPYCVNYTFPNGQKNGYLLSSGQLYLVMQNRSEVNQCLSAVNVTEITDSTAIMSSTYSNYTWNDGGQWGHMTLINCPNNTINITRGGFYSGLDTSIRILIISDFA